MPTIAEWLAAANAANEMLAQLLHPVPPPPDDWETYIEQNLWSASDWSATGGWTPVERPTQGTLMTNLSTVNGKLVFTKQASQASGYSSAVITKRGLVGASISRMQIDLEFCYPTATWPIYPNASKHIFWSRHSGSNHFIGCRNNFGGSMQPTLGLQNPNFTYYCDYNVAQGETATMSVVMDFAARWLEIWVNGERRKVNTKSWTTPDVERVENVNYFTDGSRAMPLNFIGFEPTELQITPGVKMVHHYGPLVVKGIPAMIG